MALIGFGDPITSAFQLFLKGRISSIPVVDGSGSLIDVFSLSDFLTLPKGDASAYVQVHQMTMHQALQQVYQIKGHRPSPTCFCTSTLWEVIE
ncbi:hypothetical protein J5N97_021473 [Dioscorea zingiberensis]|uniref:CBS domain-containing protein n=1 Tax=Dioscorea zingiberensis TaxID=325984 RepID=A0A9D5CII6_9LILI|nr:hypothetical protein J5N97_021473 [Dioscorea zingiberensis]